MYTINYEILNEKILNQNKLIQIVIFHKSYTNKVYLTVICDAKIIIKLAKKCRIITFAILFVLS